MKVILVNGSPNKEGNTYIALKEVADTLNTEGIETEIFWIGNEPIGGCIGCGYCYKNKKCAFGGTVNEFNEKAATADGFIFASPVHYASASGNMTSFMDRVFYSSNKNNYYLKPAACVAVARRAGTTATFDQLNKYLTISNMLVVGSKYWNCVHGLVPGDAKLDAEGLQTMRYLARNMAYVLKCQKLAKENGIEKPEKEEKREITNFIR